MDLLFSAAEVLRWVGAAQLALLIVYFVRSGANGRYAAFFCFTLICYLIAAPVLAFPGWPLVRWIVLFGAFGVAYALWILSRAIFDDSFRYRAIDAIALIMLEGLSFLSYSSGGDFLPGFLEPIGRLFPQLINLGFIIATLILVQRGAVSDMIEERRKFRRVFVMVSGIYIVIVLAAEIGLKQVRVPRLLDSANILSVVALIYYFSFRLLELKPRFFLGTPSLVINEAERSLSENIRKLMEDQKLFVREDLNARVIATILNEQEYKVRRAINGAMGYRNFYDFLNHFRIEAACNVLADEANQSTPILRIAMDCGYASLAPFNRAFKALKGISPSEFRRREKDSIPDRS